MIWVEAPNIEGHEKIVEQFKQSSDIKNLPEEYVITRDEYWVNYKGNGYVASNISDHMPYVPRRGTLTEATKIGRDEPDIFYKLLAKKNYDGKTHGNIYSTPCDLLFVRTKHKQLYKTVHKIKMYVDNDYYDGVESICKIRGESKANTGLRLLMMSNVSNAMECDFVLEGTRHKPIRVNAAKYDNAKRRERRIKQATPSWSNKQEINALHAQVWQMNKEAGFIKYDLDHDIPLYGVNDNGEHIISGLHIAANLKPMPSRENRKKSNKFDNSC